MLTMTIVNNDNAVFSKEWTSITSNLWQFLIKEGIGDKIKNKMTYNTHYLGEIIIINNILFITLIFFF